MSIIFSKNKRTNSSGFTIIEMVTVLAIFAIIASVVIFNLHSFSTKVSLDNLAQDVALAVRNVQVEAVSGRIGAVPFSDAPSYGLGFSSTSPNSFFHFADYNNNKVMDPGECGGEGTECLEKITLQDGYEIHDVCATPYDATETVEVCGITNFALTFTRPNPEPLGISTEGGTSYGDVRIKLLGPDNHLAIIHLWQTGQVEVE